MVNGTWLVVSGNWLVVSGQLTTFRIKHLASSLTGYGVNWCLEIISDYHVVSFYLRCVNTDVSPITLSIPHLRLNLIPPPSQYPSLPL